MMGTDHVWELIAQLSDQDEVQREKAAYALGYLGDSRAVKALIDTMLDDGTEDDNWTIDDNLTVQGAAAEALGIIGDPLAVDALVQITRDAYSENDNVIQLTSKATTALRRIDDSRAIELLIQQLSHASHFFRFSAVSTLDALGNPIASDAIARAMLEDEDEIVRETAAISLGQLGDKRALVPLLEILQDIENEWAKFAAHSLGEIGDPRAIQPLINALRDDDFEVRAGAALALGSIGDPQAVDALIELLKDKNYRVRPAAARALGDIGDERAVVPLTRAIRFSPEINHWGIKGEASSALGFIGGSLATDALCRILRYKDPLKRSYAAQALGITRNPQAIVSLSKALNDDDSYVRYWAVRSLNRIGDPTKSFSSYEGRDVPPGKTSLEYRDQNTVAPLIQALNNDDEDVRASAAMALGNIISPAAVHPLIRALDDNDKNVRRAAALALGRIGDPIAIEKLIHALIDRDVEVPEAAIAIGNIGGPLAFEVLSKALLNPDSDVRMCVTEGFGELGDPSSVELLVATLDDVHSTVRVSVVEALAKIGGVKVAEPLIYALKDQDRAVRKAAAGALESGNHVQAFESLVVATELEHHYLTRQEMDQALQSLNAKNDTSRARDVFEKAGTLAVGQSESTDREDSAELEKMKRMVARGELLKWFVHYPLTLALWVGGTATAFMNDHAIIGVIWMIVGLPIGSLISGVATGLLNAIMHIVLDN